MSPDDEDRIDPEAVGFDPDADPLGRDDDAELEPDEGTSDREPPGDGSASGSDAADVSPPTGSGRAAPAADDAEETGTIAGATGANVPTHYEITPQSISLENAAFVLLGVALALAIVVRLVAVFG